MSGRDRTQASSAERPDKLGQPRSRVRSAIGGSVALALAALALTQCGWAQQIKLDREVRRLCAIDGGVRIYETVRLPKADFGSDGEVFPQYRLLYPKGELGPNYVADYELTLLASGNPALQRIRVFVKRVADDRTLGEFIDYKRSGGDFVGPWEPSRKSCATSQESGSLYKRIFIQEAQ